MAESEVLRSFQDELAEVWAERDRLREELTDAVTALRLISAKPYRAEEITLAYFAAAAGSECK